MKLERMLSIIIYLTNREKVKAHELAEQFEVSVRTIYRDIEAISQAGIPVVTYQGAGGGIGIVEGFKLDKSVFTNDEMVNILSVLKGLHSISEDTRLKFLMEKLSGAAAGTDYMPAGSEIMIDLSSWNKNDWLGSRIRQIKKSIQEGKVIQFSYYTNNRYSQRKVEPYVIVYKQSNWYLYAYCLLRDDFRLFKLGRMREVIDTGDHFKAREFSLDRVSWDGGSYEEYCSPVVLAFDKSMKYVVEDIFGQNNYQELDDERLKVTFNFEVSGWLYGFILGFGDRVEVLEPSGLRKDIQVIAKSVCKIYD